MMFFNNIKKPVMEAKSLTQQEFTIPLKVSEYKSKHQRLICLNTHVMNTMYSGITFWIPLMTALDVFKNGVPLLKALAVNTVASSIFLGYTILDQLFAVDFGSFCIDDNKEVNFGEDIRGLSVVSIGDGIVVGNSDSVPNKTSATEKLIRKYGNYLVIKYDDFCYASYCHLIKGSQTVKIGDRVKKGQIIAKVGNSGNSSVKQPHLHFEMCFTKIPGAKTIPFVYDFPKPLKGFEPHQYTPIGLRTALKIWIPNSTINEIENTVKFGKLETNNTGRIHWACFLSKPIKG